MKFTVRRVQRVAICSLLASALPALAQSGVPAPIIPITPDPRLAAIHDSMGHTQMPGQVAISPDAKLLAYTQGGRTGGSLHLTDLATSKETPITPGPNCATASPTWSPDSQTLAFTATCGEKSTQPQIYLWSRATSAVTQLTHLKGIFQQAVFSPDAKSLTFLFVENATRNAGALAAMKPWSGVIGDDGVEVQRVYGVPIASGKGQWISPPNLHVYEFAYNPAKPEVTYIAAAPPGENTWWIAKLYTQSLYNLNNSSPTVVFDPNTTKTALHGLQIAVPPLLPQRRAHRLHRRSYVRPGLHRRRRLDGSRHRGRTHRRHPQH